MSTEKYRIVVRYSAPKEAFEALAPEIPGCEAEGATRAEALANLEQELVAQLENMEAQGVEPPQPLDLQDFDGRISAAVSPELHRELVFYAREMGLELPALVAELLARQTGGGGGGGPRRGRPAEGRGGRRGGPMGQRYHDIMDNRENFIEYVRSLDGGGGGGGGGGSGGGGSAGRRGGGRRPR